ncbi:hypothetical protein [Streptomyces hydrogenans]|uniref:hypothetical protein n=1 Tax=Streptomyces hydrogenans TaxID=1873719 RepID=UPI001CFE3D73|nr:hypothetical protein [Streptomyces hydrogenans]
MKYVRSSLSSKFRSLGEPVRCVVAEDDAGVALAAQPGRYGPVGEDLQQALGRLERPLVVLVHHMVQVLDLFGAS